jgi:hypothetical protein
MSQYSVLRVKIYPKASVETDSDGEDDTAPGACFRDISEVIVKRQGEESETIDVSQLIAYLTSMDSNWLIEQRQLPPSVNMSATDAVYAPGRGVCGVLLARKNISEGVIIYDLEEDEEEEGEEEDGSEGEDGESEEKGEEEGDESGEEDIMVI